jgi:enolase
MQDVRSKGEVAIVDLGVVSKELMTQEREKGVCNGVLVKMVDYGSVSEVIET